MDLFKKRPKFFVLKYARVEKRPADKIYRWYAFEPHVIYPATVKRIREVLASGEIPEELVDNQAMPGVDPRSVAMAYASSAKQIPGSAWGDALVDRGDFEDPLQIALRADALTLARRWVTQA